MVRSVGRALREIEFPVEKALWANALTRDAIAQFLIPQEDWRQTTFRLDSREHLRRVKVAQTDISAYGELISPRGGS